MKGTFLLFLVIFFFFLKCI